MDDEETGTNTVSNIGSILKRIYPKKAVVRVPKTSMDLRLKAAANRILKRKGKPNG
jgi:hypothetical protein